MNAKKILAMCLAAVMLVAASVAGTLAYLKAESNEVKNTFTTTGIGLKLDESPLNADHKTINTEARRVDTNEDYEMVPGRELPKDPRVTVLADSEECYVFVEVVENGTVGDFLEYSINATDWTPVAAGSNVYYYKSTITRSDKDQMVDSKILTDDKVTVKSGVTKEDMATLEGENALDKPELKFYGYAVQKEGFDSAVAAWNETFGKPQDTDDDADGDADGDAEDTENNNNA